MMLALGVAVAALLAAGCGGSDQPAKKDEPMKVEDTAFGPLVGTPKKVEDRVNASQDQYRESLEQRLQEDEGSTPKQDDPPAD